MELIFKIENGECEVKIHYNKKWSRWEGLHRILNPVTGQPLQKFGFDFNSKVADTKQELINKYLFKLS